MNKLANSNTSISKVIRMLETYISIVGGDELVYRAFQFAHVMDLFNAICCLCLQCCG